MGFDGTGEVGDGLSVTTQILPFGALGMKGTAWKILLNATIS